jgi:hypothetical protein
MIKNKILIAFFAVFISSYFFYSADFQLKIIEKKGRINIKEKNTEWKELSNENTIAPQTEIFTDFHSQMTFEVGPGSYITVNQLTNMTFEDQKINANDIMTEMKLSNGFLTVYSAKVKSYKNRIKINLTGGNALFENSGGEIYLRAKQGAIIKSFQGLIKIYPKIKTYYFITKNEICGITPAGILLESDYFLKRNINTLPNDIENPGQVEYYFNYIFQPYTKNHEGIDYKDALMP